MRSKVYFALMVLLVLAVGELLAYFFLARSATKLLFPDPSLYTAGADELDWMRAVYDPDIGWRNPYRTKLGERPRKHDYGRPLISAYGDSFTHGDEVESTETWEEHLSQLLGADVYNFGGSGYGIDQAYLRFEREFPRRPTPITILGFISGDIERNVSVYFRFMQPQSHFSLTKPRFLRSPDGELHLLPNPIESIDELERLRDPAFIREIGRNDEIWNLHGLPELGFPHLAIFLRPKFWMAVVRHRQRVDLWHDEGPRRLTEELFLRFHRLSLERGAKPYIIHFPTSWEIFDYNQKPSKVPSSVQSFEELCRRFELNCLIPIADSRLRRFQPNGIHALYVEGGHFSPTGNRFFARYLARRLADEPAVLALGKSLPVPASSLRDDGEATSESRSSPE